MAVAGTDLPGFRLGGREVLRRDGRLTLADGTLAGADTTLPQEMRILVERCGLPVPAALAMATSVPAAAIGLGRSHGRLGRGRAADLVHLAEGFAVAGVWQGGERRV
jgi:N-acetylglucosamine-6-phosphate deacetylase